MDNKRKKTINTKHKPDELICQKLFYAVALAVTFARISPEYDYRKTF
jgi:hypothetical protein